MKNPKLKISRKSPLEYLRRLRKYRRQRQRRNAVARKQRRVNRRC